MNKRFLSILALATCLPASFARAAEDLPSDPLLAMDLEQLMAFKVNISTHTHQTLSKAPGVVSVITAEDIKATGATNLVDVLQTVPGIYVRTNQFGYRPLVTFRGAAASHTLLMINGAPVRDLVWASGIYGKGLPANVIERVEIIRGPGSALYGTDASAGVINVITKTATNVAQNEAGVRAGSFGTQEGWARAGGSWHDFDLSFTANFFTTDGHRPLIAADAQTVQDQAVGTRASFAPGRAALGWDGQDLRFSLARGNWRFNADYARQNNVQTGFTGAGVLDPRTRGESTRYNTDLLYANDAFARDWGLRAELRYSHLDYDSGPGFLERPPGFRCTTNANCGGAAPGLHAEGWINRQRARESRLSGEVSGLYTGFAGHAVRIGAGHIAQDLYQVDHWTNAGKGPDGRLLPANSPLTRLSDTPWAFAPEKMRTIAYAFLQDGWGFAPGWELTLGARYDHYSDFGGTLNPRFALVWQTTDRLTTKLMHGKAFRAPSYLELYSQTSATRPNAGLAPETSHTWDLAFLLSATRDLKLGATFYQFAQANLIGLVGGRYDNVGDTKSRGVEFEAQWQAGRTLRFSGNFDVRHDDITPYRAYDVPLQMAYVRADWAFAPGWNWNLQATYTGKHRGAAGDTRAPPSAHTVADTTLRYTHGKQWEFAVAVRNLFAADVREYTPSRGIGEFLPLPGRNYYGEARLKF